MKRTWPYGMSALAFVFVKASLPAAAEPFIVARNIAAGEVFTHTGSVEVKGAVGPRARVTVTQGGITVDGDIGKGASIVTKDGGVRMSKGDSGVIIRGSSTVTVNGWIVPSGDSDREQITVNGMTGYGVKLSSNGSIVAGDADGKLTARAGGSLILGRVGPKASLSAGGSITAGAIGPSSLVNAGGSINGGDIGKTSLLSAGGSITAGYVRARSLSAGGSIIAQGAEDASGWRAGGSIVVP